MALDNFSQHDDLFLDCIPTGLDPIHSRMYVKQQVPGAVSRLEHNAQ
jgi:hypothetical protein